MLYQNEQQRRTAPEDGSYQVAGLLDVVKLLSRLGTPNADDLVRVQREAATLDPRGAFNDTRTFIDPRGRLMMDTGQIYEGKPLKSFNSLNALVDNAPTLDEYLAGTEIGDMFAPEFSRIKIGQAPLGGGFEAGLTNPTGFVDKAGNFQTVQPGFLVVNSSVPKSKIPELVEHETQHGIQYVQRGPQGANFDAMSNDFMDYYQEQGIVSPQLRAAIDAEALQAGVSRPEYRYMSTTGEAEARVPQRQILMRAEGVDPGMPSAADYAWTGRGYEINPRNLFDLVEDPQEGFSNWWKQKWSK